MLWPVITMMNVYRCIIIILYALACHHYDDDTAIHILYFWSVTVLTAKCSQYNYVCAKTDMTTSTIINYRGIVRCVAAL